jgi:hypothetical protein
MRLSNNSTEMILELFLYTMTRVGLAITLDLA